MNLEKSDDLNQETVAIKKKDDCRAVLQQFNTLDMNNYGSWPASVKNNLLDFYFWLCLHLAILW